MGSGGDHGKGVGEVWAECPCCLLLLCCLLLAMLSSPAGGQEAARSSVVLHFTGGEISCVLLLLPCLSC